MFDECVAILLLVAQRAHIQDMRVFPIMRGRHVHFAQIDACTLPGLAHFLLLLEEAFREIRACEPGGGDRFVLRAGPVNDERRGELPGPIQDQGPLSLPLESRSFPSRKRIAERLYSTGKNHVRLRGGRAVGSALRCSRQLLSPTKKDLSSRTQRTVRD